MHTPKNLEEFQELIASDKLVIVDFTATWCGPCRVIGPKFHKLAEEHPEFIFAQVDVDDVADVAAAQGIRAMPTIKYYKNGEALGEVVGANFPKIVETMNKHA